MENPFKKENIKKAVKIGLMSTALAFGTADANEVSAQTNQIEQSITPQTSWAKDAVNLANKDLKYIKNERDAFEYSIKICKLFTNQIGIIADSQNKNKNYSLEEYQYLNEQAKKIYEIVQKLDDTYHINRSSVLDNVMFILEDRSSYGGYNEYQRIKNFKMN